MATLATFVRIPVSVALGAASMTGAIASGIISVLAKKYQKKLKKVTRTKYNVGPGYWYANYPSDCLKSNPLIGHITGLSWCWKHRNELSEIFGKV